MYWTIRAASKLREQRITRDAERRRRHRLGLRQERRLYASGNTPAHRGAPPAQHGRQDRAKPGRSRRLPPRRLAPKNYQDADREIYEPHGLVNCDALVPVGYAVADASQVIDALCDRYRDPSLGDRLPGESLNERQRRTGHAEM